MNRVLVELNNDQKTQKIYLIHIYNLLTNLSGYSRGAYESALEGLYHDFYFLELINNEWGSDFISEPTREFGKLFHHSWRQYVNAVSYGYSFWVYYDENWYKLLNEKFIPFMKLLDLDLTNNRVNSDLTNEYELSRKKFDFKVHRDKRPDEEYLLSTIENLCRLLLKNKIIERPYLG